MPSTQQHAALPCTHGGGEGGSALTGWAGALCDFTLKLWCIRQSYGWWLTKPQSQLAAHGGLTVVLRCCVQVARNADISEWTKLEFLREIGFCHMRIGDGVNSRLQLSGMLAKLCKVAIPTQ
jgi:hypothetical protein